MANEILSMSLAQVPRPAAESGRIVKLDAVNTPERSGESLPVEGKQLPQMDGKQSANNTELREAVSQINNFVQTVQRDLSFSMDEASGHTIIKVIDSETGKLVRQIPSEEVLALATYLKDVSSINTGDSNAPQGILFSDMT